MRARRMELGGYLPARRPKATALVTPELAAFERFLKSTEDREISTTMAFVQILQLLLRDKNLGKHIVPIVPDESRTFGMEGMFRQLGIWNQQGQLYTPQDADQLMFYKESKNGQILQEGINEAGGMCDWIAAATSLLDARRADDPVLHLLLDVRLPARRRPRVGGRRHALARLPAGRHRRAHDAERRGPAARGRPLAPDVGDDPELHLLRPDVRLRGRGDHPGRPAADVRRAAGRLLLPDRDERELPRSRRCRKARRRRSSRACTCSARARRRRRRRACSCWARDDLPRGDRGRGAAASRLGRRIRPLELPELHRARARRDDRRPRRTCCNPTAKPKLSHVERASRTRRVR